MSLQINVDASSLENIANGLESLTSNFPNAVGAALMKVGASILEAAETLVPVRTGYLKSTLALTQISNFQIQLQATAGYALFVEFGTRRMSARLFLTTAIKEHGEDFSSEIQTQVLNLVDEYFGE